MPRFFVNNFATTLSGNITNVQTTLPLQTGDGALLPTITFDPPSDVDYLLTISDGTNTEVVQVEGHDGSDTIAEITRNYDGNGSFAFQSGDAVEMRLTAQSMEQLWDNMSDALGRNAKGNFAVDIVPFFSSVSHIAEADRSINIGAFCGINAGQTRSINIGEFSQLTSATGVNIVIGGSIGNMGADDCVLIGNNPGLSGSGYDRTVKIGHEGQVRDIESVGVGDDVNLSGEGAIIIGPNNGLSAANSSRNSIIMGRGWVNAAVANVANTFGGMVQGLADDAIDDPIRGMARIQWPRAFGLNLELEDGVTAKPSYANNGTEVTLAARRISDFSVAAPFAQTRTFYTFALPADCFMFVEEVGVVFDTVVGGPTTVNTDLVIDVGSSGVDSTDILNAQNVTSSVVPVVEGRNRFTPGNTDQGYNAITVTIDTAIALDSGGTSGYVYIRGIIYQSL